LAKAHAQFKYLECDWLIFSSSGKLLAFRKNERKMKIVIGSGPRAPTDNFIERPPALIYEIVARAQKLKKKYVFFSGT
jgi:Uma2 family endonuclease